MLGLFLWRFTVGMFELSWYHNTDLLSFPHSVHPRLYYTRNWPDIEWVVFLAQWFAALVFIRRGIHASSALPSRCCWFDWALKFEAHIGQSVIVGPVWSWSRPNPIYSSFGTLISSTEIAVQKGNKKDKAFYYLYVGRVKTAHPIGQVSLKS